ncbi:MAG TPA: trypsin-like peptidase domain-containing protein [Cellulomonas sp.]
MTTPTDGPGEGRPLFAPPSGPRWTAPEPAPTAPAPTAPASDVSAAAPDTAPVEPAPAEPRTSPGTAAPAEPTAPSAPPRPADLFAAPTTARFVPPPTAAPGPTGGGPGEPVDDGPGISLVDPAPGAAAPARARGARRRRVPAGLVVVLVLAALVAGAVGGAAGAWLVQDDDHLADAGLPAAVGTGTGDRAPDSVAGIAAQVLPSVVSIQVTTAEGSATGSGVVLRQDGYILTNHHVVADASAPGATMVALFADGSQESATVVGSTADYDLAVIKVGVTGLTPLVLGDSDTVQVGDPVVAVGAPLGLAGTVTSGIVSALNRPVAAGDGSQTTAFINAIQTDAAINPGNSGGPLVNAAGEVVGINSAIAQPPGVSTSAGGSIGLGFAIPSNQARRTAEQLIETGTATYPVIGVLLDSTYTGEGVQVLADAQDGAVPVTPGGPADRAGIRAGDVILSIDGRPVTESDELVVAIRARTPGDAVVLRVRSGGTERDVRVVLDESSAG